MRDSFSVDLVGIGELAENTYPFPFTDTIPEKMSHFGGRLKWSLGGFSFTALSAQIQNKNYYGLSGNYAFDQFVPKIEMGSKNSETSFGTLGVDMFIGSWVLMPQVSVYEVQGLEQKETHTTVYFSFQWNPSRFDIQVQAYKNVKNEDAFVSASCGYNLTDSFTLSGFAQNYAGTEGLYRIYQEMTGGTVFGLRAELTGNLVF